METQEKTKKKRGLKIALIILAVVLVLVLAVVIFGASLFSRFRQNLVPIVQGPQQDSAANLATPSAELFTEALRTDIDYYETGIVFRICLHIPTKRERNNSIKIRAIPLSVNIRFFMTVYFNIKILHVEPRRGQIIIGTFDQGVF